ncbi:MAG: putative capsule-related protein [Daejeonella sp.]|nr:putative capsule-related protein [Daejeonella sp.]
MTAIVLKTIWILCQIAVGYNLVLPLVLYVVSFIKTKKHLLLQVSEKADYAIIVTAYQQTHTITAAVSSILKIQNENFLIYVVADNCDASNLFFEDPRVILLCPETVLGSNTRSHFYAIKNFKRDHNRITIIDSDNIVQSEYLKELNFYFDSGFKAVQGIRLAKNLDTSYACLDAARDIYYHFYDGKILFQIGSSATLSGSGMAFTTELFKDCLEHQAITGAGFDKVLQFEILKRNLRIAFSEKAIVYDEKTSRSDQLVNQRSRWINTWFKYFNYGFKLIAKGITNLSLNQFVFGVILLRPPLFIFLILSFLAFSISIWIAGIAFYVWLSGFALFIISFLVALMSSKTDPRIYKSLINIPKFIFFQILSLIKIRTANKISVATEHYHVNRVDEKNVKY